jgi:flagellar protein FliS
LSSLKSLNAYRETDIKTASQGKLILLLYDEAIKKLSLAEEQLGKERPKMDQINNAILRAQEMITELIVSLNFEKGGDMAQNLFALYMYFNRQLMLANIKKDQKPVAGVLFMLRELRQAWAQAIQKEKGSRDSQPGMMGVNIAG